jgi:hypothetical protein
MVRVLYGNLVRVRGTGAASGITYLGVGADTASWAVSQPVVLESEVTTCCIEEQLPRGSIKVCP